jgi:Rieske Fe-S protein
MSDDTIDTICVSCESGVGPTSRRMFLQLAAGLTISAAVLGLDPADATALPVVEKNGQASGSEHRYPMPAADGVTIDSAAQIILVRYQSHVYAFNLSCPHQNTALKWRPKDGRFQCPKHDSKYQPNGAFMSGRATRNMDRLAVRRDDASLVVDVNKWFQSDKDPSGWAAASITL